MAKRLAILALAGGLSAVAAPVASAYLPGPMPEPSHAPLAMQMNIERIADLPEPMPGPAAHARSQALLVLAANLLKFQGPQPG